jgi:hypothetical protein
MALPCLLRLGIAAARTNDRFGPMHLQDPWWNEWPLPESAPPHAIGHSNGSLGPFVTAETSVFRADAAVQEMTDLSLNYLMLRGVRMAAMRGKPDAL